MYTFIHLIIITINLNTIHVLLQFFLFFRKFVLRFSSFGFIIAFANNNNNSSLKSLSTIVLSAPRRRHGNNFRTVFLWRKKFIVLKIARRLRSSDIGTRRQIRTKYNTIEH